MCVCVNKTLYFSASEHYITKKAVRPDLGAPCYKSIRTVILVMSKILSFSNQKGGVGKTTTCVNMSAYLALFGKKVLLIDLDPQGNASSGLGVQKNALKHSTYSLLCDPDFSAADAIIDTVIPGLSIIPSNIDLAGAEIELVNMENNTRMLTSAIDKIKDDYDYITIDCPPSLGLLTINALAASSGVIIPIQCEFYALEGLTQLINTIKLVIKHLKPTLEIEGVVMTMYDSRALVSVQIAAEIKKYFGKKLFTHAIPRNIRVSEAPSHGVPVMLHDNNCAGTRAYRRLTKEFLNREEERLKQAQAEQPSAKSAADAE